MNVWFRAVERNGDDQREQGQPTCNRISNSFVSAIKSRNWSINFVINLKIKKKKLCEGPERRGIGVGGVDGYSEERNSLAAGEHGDGSGDGKCNY